MSVRNTVLKGVENTPVVTRKVTRWTKKNTVSGAKSTWSFLKDVSKAFKKGWKKDLS